MPNNKLRNYRPFKSPMIFVSVFTEEGTAKKTLKIPQHAPDGDLFHIPFARMQTYPTMLDMCTCVLVLYHSG
jgi:hypothetical protein